VTIDTPVDWRQWYDFYQAVIKPLVEAGADIRIQVHLDASGELDIHWVDLSIQGSVVQLDAEGNVRTES